MCEVTRLCVRAEDGRLGSDVMRLEMIPNSGMIGKEERGSDGSRSLSSSSSPPVEGPESLQGQGFEPSAPTPGLYLCLD